MIGCMSNGELSFELSETEISDYKKYLLEISEQIFGPPSHISFHDSRHRLLSNGSFASLTRLVVHDNGQLVQNLEAKYFKTDANELMTEEGSADDESCKYYLGNATEITFDTGTDSLEISHFVAELIIDSLCEIDLSNVESTDTDDPDPVMIGVKPTLFDQVVFYEMREILNT